MPSLLSFAKRLAVAAVGAATLYTSSVNAQPQAAQVKQEAGYSYAFSDDPLVADGFLPNESRIQVRGGAVRVALIRPRVTFVPQMLKSVENL